MITVKIDTRSMTLCLILQFMMCRRRRLGGFDPLSSETGVSGVFLSRIIDAESFQAYTNIGLHINNQTQFDQF